MTEPDEGDRHTVLTLVEEPLLPQPFDGGLCVQVSDLGRISVVTVVRPNIGEVAQGRVVEWMLQRIRRVLVPDGAEPDPWEIDVLGRRCAFHTPDDGPDWTDALP